MAIHKMTTLDPDKTIDFLLENHDELECKFHQFFPDLVEYVRNEKQNLISIEKLITF